MVYKKAAAKIAFIIWLTILPIVSKADISNQTFQEIVTFLMAVSFGPAIIGLIIFFLKVDDLKKAVKLNLILLILNILGLIIWDLWAAKNA